MNNIGKLLSFFLLVSLLVPNAAFADKALQNALAKAQFMLRQANAEKVSLQKEHSELKKTFDNYKKDMEKELKAKDKGNKKLTNSISDIKNKYVDLHTQFMELRERYVSTVKETHHLTALLNKEKDNFQLCFDNNRKLFDVNKEILGQYENKGFWDVMNQQEPFLGLSQVEIENLVQEYQYQSEDLLVSDALFEESQSEQVQ
ncbi:MAG: hypothetical protein MI867_06805 [Pseudomonadales bacterium]|nr:hypothetical protein [Pseudomonadales bacterium]